MASPENIYQVYTANPITSNASTDLMYFGQSPYGITSDAAMTYANFAAQFQSVLTLPLSGSNGGTGVNNGSSTITIGGNVAFSGAYTFTGTLTGNTGVTFPTSGTLATTSQIPSGAALTETNDTNVTLTLGGSPTTALVNAASITAGWTGQLAISRGGTAVSSVTTAPTATSFAGWDSNKNLSANAIIPGYTSTATSGTTTTLTVASTYAQAFTGTSSNQTVTMPVTSTLVQGQQYYIFNNTTSGTLTIQSSGANTIVTNGLSPGWGVVLTCVNTGVTTAAGWTYQAAPNNAFTFFSGTNTSVSNTGGQITINCTKSASFAWNSVASGTQTISTYQGYFTNNGASLVTFTLPSSATVDSFFRIGGYSSGGWTIAQNASQNIAFEGSTTTTGTGGSLSSTNANDCCTILCTVANTNFIVVDAIGNLTVV